MSRARGVAADAGSAARRQLETATKSEKISLAKIAKVRGGEFEVRNLETGNTEFFSFFLGDPGDLGERHSSFSFLSANIVHS
jgi:hypothetical protein